MDPGTPGRNGGFHAITSNCRPESDSNKSPLIISSLRVSLDELALVQRTASELISTAVTAAPSLAAHRATMPEPHPISRKAFPAIGSDVTKRARIELDPQ